MTFNEPPLKDGWSQETKLGPRVSWALWFTNVWKWIQAPTAPTQTPGDNTTAVATDAFVQAAITAAVAGLTFSSSSYTSTVSTLPAAGVAVSVAHALGASLKSAQLQLVCITAEQGYSIGDVIDAPTGSTSTYWFQQIVWHTTTNVGFTTPTGQVNWFVGNKTTGAPVALTPANWGYRFVLRT